MRKRTFVVALLCLCAFFSVTACAEIVDSGKFEDNLTWTFDDNGTLVISGTGDMRDFEYDENNVLPYLPYPYTNISPFLRNDRIKSLIIEDGVTSIGDYAFMFASEITDIKLPDTLVSIGDNAFCQCSYLKEIKIPDSVTSIGDNAFSGCEYLKEIIIPDSVTSIGEAAFSGYRLERIIVGENNANYTADDGVLFDKQKTTIIICPSAKECASYTIPDGVTSIGNCAFELCRFLKEIAIPDSVTSIGKCAFYNCNNLLSIEMPDSVTIIGKGAFANCENLETAEISEAVTSIGESVFEDCRAIKEINVPDGVTSIGKNAFQGCRNLVKIKLPAGLTSIGERAFLGCDVLESIEIPGRVTSIGQEAFLDCDEIRTIQLPGSLTHIEDSTFYDCYSLRNVQIPFGVASIGKNAFSQCRNLENVIISNSVTSIDDEAFNDCNEEAVIYGGMGTAAIDCAKKKRLRFVDTQIAIPTNANVIVNGNKISFTAYNVGGNNYFKLRDIAMALNGSEKNFNVGWDGVNHIISLTKNQGYTVVGGELVVNPEADISHLPQVTESKITVDGERIWIIGFGIGDNNYFKLRDIGKCFDFGIGWDSATKTITIDTAESYIE